MFNRQLPLVWRQDLDTDNNPLRTWIMQLALIMTLNQLLFYLLKKSRQPRVIAEIFAGILLSPSALGRIPGFTDTFFPEISKPSLFLIADIGLILFLFLIGLEIDGPVVRKAASMSASIALGGIILPFGLGSALSVPLYSYFANPDVEFTHFFLFIGIAFSITAFPVLCRISTELKLLDTTIGIVVLSAGVLNDIFGWILLALSLTLARSTSSLAALWMLLYCITWVVFLFIPVRRVFFWLAQRTGSISNGPTMLFMTVSILTMFCSALFTDLIGVHAIFGAFLVGLIIPREGGLAISLKEKLDDMVSIIFLPLYFTASGLSTDFGLLNDRITWAFTLAIIVLAWTGKFGGGLLAARISGFQWREAASIGTLLSCKGLIELIVLNVGLSAGILNKTVFSMFVLEALTLTFLTTPVVMSLYPPEYRRKALHDVTVVNGDAERNPPCFDIRRKSLITVVLDKMDELPGVMNFMELLNDRTPSHGRFNVKALRLIELTERSSDAKKSSAIERLLATDSLLKIFKTYCRINWIDVSASLSIIPLEDFASEVVEGVSGHPSELVVIPCPGAYLYDNHDIGGEISKNLQDNSNLYATITGSHLQFLRRVFSECKADSIVLIERGSAPIEYGSGHHFILPFFGGVHDRLALRLVLQLCTKSDTTATIIRIPSSQGTLSEQTNTEAIDTLDDTSFGFDFSSPESSFDLDAEEKVDDDMWRECIGESNTRTELQGAFQRIEFLKEKTLSLTNVLLRLHLEIKKVSTERSKRPVIILSQGGGCRAQRSNSSDSGGSPEGFCYEITASISPDVVETLGVLPSAVLANTDGDRTGLMIVHSGCNA